jgi:SagB-type dehydrogenase family enzyme
MYRFDPDTHTLALHRPGDFRTAIRAACLNQAMLAFAALTVVLAVDIEKVASRYRDRAHRYAAMDCGHYGQNAYLACEGLGLATVGVGAFDDSALAATLELPANLAPLYLFPVGGKA